MFLVEESENIFSDVFAPFAIRQVARPIGKLIFW